MPKINIRVTRGNKNKTTSNDMTGIYQDGILKYKEPEDAIVVFDYNKRYLKREDGKSRHEFDFNSGILNIFFKEIGQSTDVKVKIKKMIEEDKNIEIEYEFEKEEFIYRIEELR